MLRHGTNPSLRRCSIARAPGRGAGHASDHRAGSDHSRHLLTALPSCRPQPALASRPDSIAIPGCELVLRVLNRQRNFTALIAPPAIQAPSSYDRQGPGQLIKESTGRWLLRGGALARWRTQPPGGSVCIVQKKIGSGVGGKIRRRWHARAGFNQHGPVPRYRPGHDLSAWLRARYLSDPLDQLAKVRMHFREQDFGRVRADAGF